MDCFKELDFENDGFENQWLLKEGFEVESFFSHGSIRLGSAMLTTGRSGQVFCFWFDNCNNTILVYAYILIYYRLAVVSGCVKVAV